MDKQKKIPVLKLASALVKELVLLVKGLVLAFQKKYANKEFVRQFANTVSTNYQSFRAMYAEAKNAQITEDNSDLGFLADSSVKTIQGPHPASHLILKLIGSFIIIALIWSKLAILDETAVGDGKIIPSSQIQVVQNLEGGIVRDILVHESDIVQKGQVLMHIDDTSSQSTFQSSQEKATALSIKIARLNAVTQGTPFQPPADTAKGHPDLVANEQQLYNTQTAQLQQLQHSRDLANQEFQMTKPLVKDGAASKVELLRLERTISDIDGQISDFRTKALDELSDAKAQLASLQQSNIALQDRVVRTTVRSPVKGIVKTLKINTVGGVVQPGSDLADVVPLEDTLLVEAKIPPRDIGFIRLNQPATVKITAYDYSIYGGLKGKVEQISADSLTNEKGDSYYLIRVRTHKNYLGTSEKPLYIIPGMMASVNILTGRKSVMDYLLKPILKAKDNAMHER